jgi:DNA-binding transcriptional LysR family regulator
MFDLRQLRHFVALAEHGHFARAAEAVHLSQPALSRSIQALEATLDCLLVDRHSRGISLTAHGQLVLEHAKRILAGSQALKNSVGQLSNLHSGELLLGVGPYLAARLVPLALGRFAMRYPQVHTRMMVEGWRPLRERLLRGDIELFVADTREIDNQELLHVMPLTPRPGRLVCRPGHPLLSLADYTPLNVLDYPLVCAGLPEPIEMFLKKASGREQLITVQCDNYMVLREIVVSSDAVSIAPWDAVARDVAAGILAALPRGKLMPPQTADYGIVTRQDNSLSPAADAFCRLLLEVDKEIPSSE